MVKFWSLKYKYFDYFFFLMTSIEKSFFLIRLPLEQVHGNLVLAVLRLTLILICIPSISC